MMSRYVLTFIFTTAIAVLSCAGGVQAQVQQIEAESMTTGGPYAGVIQNPFTGVGLYGNGDFAQQTINLSIIPGQYAVTVRGASSNTTAASVSLFIDASKKIYTFTVTSPTSQTQTFLIDSGTQSKTLKLLMEADTGVFDTYVDAVEIAYLGVVPTPPPNPSPSTIGAFESGIYRNLFKEWGKTDTEIQAKVISAWNGLFYGSNDGNKDNQNNMAVYKNIGSDMAFVEDINNSDIRTEGMSYGMMIAVQLNKKEEFDRLWKFARTHMLCPRTTQCLPGSGLNGYFSWQMRATPPYDALDQNPAPDGEEYYATALLFASGRWGDTGAFNYRADAQAILDAMVNNNRISGVSSMFNLNKKVVVFSPMGGSANYSDPSYHVPAFYEVWALYDQKPEQRAFWSEVAAQSRAYWKVASGHNSGRTNGLMPDCTDLDGIATYGCAGGAIYAYDAWRTISNVAVDFAWWAKDPWNTLEADRLQAFFAAKRPVYGNKWNMDGSSAAGEQGSTGQIAMNAVAGLAATSTNTWDFLGDLWDLPIPTGRYRYYDGMLYLLALLHLSGNFKVYPPSGTPQPTPLSTYDLFSDGKINGLDFSKLVMTFGAVSSDSRFDPQADYDGNAVINGSDVLEWLRHFLP